jgi:hypothetical protein
VLQEKLNVLKAAVDKGKDKPGPSAKVAKAIQKLEKRIAKKQAKAVAPSPQELAVNRAPRGRSGLSAAAASRGLHPCRRKVQWRRGPLCQRK